MSHIKFKDNKKSIKINPININFLHDQNEELNNTIEFSQSIFRGFINTFSK